MEITGKIIAVLDAREGVSKTTGNAWKMQDYVLETHDQYPRRMVFNVFGEDKITDFKIQVGEEMTVSFDINAREYNGRWYNDIRAWKVDRNTASAEGAPVAQDADAAPIPPMPEVPTEDSADDLPF